MGRSVGFVSHFSRNKGKRSLVEDKVEFLLVIGRTNTHCKLVIKRFTPVSYTICKSEVKIFVFNEFTSEYGRPKIIVPHPDISKLGREINLSGVLKITFSPHSLSSEDFLVPFLCHKSLECTFSDYMSFRKTNIQTK